jgi:hypothetical protein
VRMKASMHEKQRARIIAAHGLRCHYALLA